MYKDTGYVCLSRRKNRKSMERNPNPNLQRREGGMKRNHCISMRSGFGLFGYKKRGDRLLRCSKFNIDIGIGISVAT
jgi:hypothetical protein